MLDEIGLLEPVFRSESVKFLAGGQANVLLGIVFGIGSEVMKGS